MSGGAFDYKQHYIGDIADEIEQTIIEAGRKIPHEILSRNYWYGRSTFDKEETYPMYERKTIEIMKRAVYVLRMAHIYAQRIDWMLSCDDTEETMAERLDKELRELKAKYPSGRLLEEEDVAFDIREETVYLYDGESITVPCVSDEKFCVTMGRTHLSGIMCLRSTANSISPSQSQGR